MSVIGYETKAVVTAKIPQDEPVNTREIGQNTGNGQYPAPVYLLMDLDRDGLAVYLRNDLLAPPPPPPPSTLFGLQAPRVLTTERGEQFVMVRYAEGDTIRPVVEADGKQWNRARGWYDDHGTFLVFYDPA
jgi:hypothetical protein